MPQELRLPSTDMDLAAFISKQAHDLKSPFNRALGFIKLVLEGYDGPISEQAKEDLTIAHQNTQYTLVMLDALVNIARLRRGEILPVLEAHALGPILEQTISEWQRNYHKKNVVEISLSVPEVEILADELLLRRCLIHWIYYVNEFVVETAAIKITSEEQPDTCLFTIQSSGTKQMEPPECDLTLYGLTAKGILDLHKGEINQLIADEQGALVQFSLPKATVSQGDSEKT